MFTVAGVSAESGIPTFRDDEGFWRHFPVEELATRQGLVRTALLHAARPRRGGRIPHDNQSPGESQTLQPIHSWGTSSLVGL